MIRRCVDQRLSGRVNLRAENGGASAGNAKLGP